MNSPLPRSITHDSSACLWLRLESYWYQYCFLDAIFQCYEGNHCVRRWFFVSDNWLTNTAGVRSWTGLSCELTKYWTLRCRWKLAGFRKAMDWKAYTKRCWRVWTRWGDICGCLVVRVQQGRHKLPLIFLHAVWSGSCKELVDLPKLYHMIDIRIVRPIGSPYTWCEKIALRWNKKPCHSCQ